MHKWLLIPHVLGLLAFLLAYLWMSAVGTNRSTPDLNLGITGYVMAGLALVGTLVTLVIFPYSQARPIDWWVLAAHAVLLLANLVAGFLWLALHIA